MDGFLNSNTMEKKYKFTNYIRRFKGKTLHRIVALRNFFNIKAGQKGCWIEKESNLSHENNGWVSGDAIVCDKGCISGEAINGGMGKSQRRGNCT